jgi:hypothetical protein
MSSKRLERLERGPGWRGRRGGGPGPRGGPASLGGEAAEGAGTTWRPGWRGHRGGHRTRGSPGKCGNHHKDVVVAPSRGVVGVSPRRVADGVAMKYIVVVVVYRLRARDHMYVSASPSGAQGSVLTRRCLYR